MKKLLLIFAFFCLASSEVSAQWVKLPVPDTADIGYLYAHGDTVLGGTGGYWGPSLWRSVDNGDHWATFGAGFGEHQGVNIVFPTDSFLFAATRRGIMRSKDNGLNWDNIYSGHRSSDFQSLGKHGNYLFAGADSVFRSSDNGNSWAVANQNLFAGMHSLISAGTSILGFNEVGVMRSTNEGVVWYGMTLPTYPYMWPVTALVLYKSKLIAAQQNNGYFISNDLGIHWTPIDTGVHASSVTGFALSGSNILAGRNTDDGVWLSVDGALHWIDFNEGLGNKNVIAIAANNAFIFAATSGGIWRRPVSDIQNADVLPSEEFGFRISPNPAGNDLWVSYSSKTPSSIKMDILNILGQNVMSLAEETQGADNYSRHFDIHSLPKGTYILRLIINGIPSVKFFEVVR